MLILVINPGSTSTKLGLFEQTSQGGLTERGRDLIEQDREDHSPLLQQVPQRLAALDSFLKEQGTGVEDLDAIVGRGGLLRPLEGGVYRINEAMLQDLRTGRYGQHASNLGAVLAKEAAGDREMPLFIVDPVVVDEMDSSSRLSGHPLLPRRSIFHALNQRSAARLTARDRGKSYQQVNFIVAHMGGGISVGAHKKGRVVDVNNALDGEGPFSPERSGTLPAGSLVDLCFRSSWTEESIRGMIKGRGGLFAYLGTTDFRILVSRCQAGDTMALRVFSAMVHQISKEIAAHGATLRGEVEAVILTGGMVKSDFFVKALQRRIDWLAPVVVLPGEREMEALAEGALAALRGEETIKEYQG